MGDDKFGARGEGGRREKGIGERSSCLGNNLVTLSMNSYGDLSFV